ncbi:MAG: MOSC domain-containing protein [Planctomycetota bacterium]
MTAVYNYPVKSCRATAVSAAGISPEGIDGDRQLMILRNGQFTNQARIAKLATVATQRIDAECIEFDGGGVRLRHTIDPSGAESTIDFYGNAVAVVDQGDALAELVSRAVGTEVRVAALKDRFRRAVPLEEFAIVDGIDQSRFVDVAPILVTNEDSLRDLNARLDTPVPMNRFRPNVVVEGLGAFGEDDVVALAGNGWKLMRATHCERCAVTCTDQETGERASEPLATLKAYRHREGGYAGGVMFGAYMGVAGSGEVRVGDTVQVVRD